MIWAPAAALARKVAVPMAIEVARQVDRQLRPHILAYRFARDIDGYVARWTGEKGPHFVVFSERHGPPVRSFPPLAATEVDLAHQEIDRTLLRHHADLPEARLARAGGTIAAAPGRIRRWGDDEEPPATP
jgi:hypothetical protein